MEKEQLVKVIDFWQKNAVAKLYNRELVEQININSKEIVDLVGPRRSGKSSVLKLLINKIKEQNNWLYINFEDPFFIENNSPLVIEELIEIYQEYFDAKLEYIFFDEIQNINKWENVLRKLRDSEKYKIFITGSSSKLLSSELATVLSGRHLSYQLLPLSFNEYLIFHNIKLKQKKDLIIQAKKILKLFDDFLIKGGFPQIVKTDDISLLKQYYNDILQKDILKRYQVRESNILQKMGIFLLSNAAKTVSLNSLKKLYGISFELVARYWDYFLESFLLFEIPQFSYSLKTQQKSLKKVYAIDTGLANTVSFRFSEDKGRMLENAVFLHLKKLSAEIFYYKSANHEIDFLVKHNDKKIDIIQVVWDWDEEKTKKRELLAIKDALKTIKADKIIILTYNTEEQLEVNNRKISVLPAYRWMLEK